MLKAAGVITMILVSHDPQLAEEGKRLSKSMEGWVTLQEVVKL